MKNRVFTFWEPKEAVPGYIRLCMATWAARLPGYETVVLDYRSLGDYLTPEELAAVLCRKMTFAMQSDCIRCAVLKKHGGIWLDADTVIVRPLDARFSVADVTMIARRMNGRIVNYGAFIHAAKPEAKFLCDWHAALVPRVAKTARYRDDFWFGVLHRREKRLMHRWDYCVNAIIDPLAEKMTPPDYAWLDRAELFAIPEEDLLPTDVSLNPVSAYERYWFEPGDPGEVLEKCAGIVMLHNSFTPARFRAMDEERFLATDTRLAALLRQLSGGAHS